MSSHNLGEDKLRNEMDALLIKLKRSTSKREIKKLQGELVRHATELRKKME